MLHGCKIWQFCLRVEEAQNCTNLTVLVWQQINLAGLEGNMDFVSGSFAQVVFFFGALDFY